MASGMGMPSMGIYSYELFNFFNVENIIRIGTAGALDENIRLREIILAIGASTNSAFASQFDLSGTFSSTASYPLLKCAQEVSEEKNACYTVGNVLSVDNFYNSTPEITANWIKMGIKCIEMETAALYMNAAQAGKNALSILTVSDNIITGEQTTAQERQTAFTDMMEIALEAAIKI